jgi:16S rRNA (cytosine967-C5)-methyltransferase
LIYDLLKGKVRLTVSDIRKNILFNLDARLSAAGINIYNKFTADLSVRSGLDAEEKFDIVICDAPCTGSGTWARTPEQQYAVKAEDIQAFASRQLSMLKNILPHVSPGGLLVYITCSVFAKENEAVVDELLKYNKSIKLVQKSYYKGYELDADTLFSAVFSC